MYMVSPFVRLLSSSSPLPSLPSITSGHRHTDICLATPTSSLRYLFSSEGSGYRHLYWAETSRMPHPHHSPLAHRSQVEIGLYLIQKCASIVLFFMGNARSAPVSVITMTKYTHAHTHACTCTHIHTHAHTPHAQHKHTHTPHAHTHSLGTLHVKSGYL